MVKLKGPLQSAGASGTLADVLTFNQQKRGTTLRKKPRPAQPRSPNQIASRAALEFLSNAWSTISSSQKATWSAAYPRTDLNNYNAFTRYNLERMNTGRGPSTEYPATELGIPPTAFQYSPFGLIRHIKHRLRPIIAAQAMWGAFILVDKTTPPQNDLKRLAHGIVITSLDWETWIQSPLHPGTYRTASVPFCQQGNIVWSQKITASPTVY